MTEEEYEAARLGRNALARKWRKEHPDRVKANNARYYQKKKATKLAEHNSQKETQIETNIFDQREVYTNCTVEVLTNSVTGEVSVGWWRNEEGGQDDA